MEGRALGGDGGETVAQGWVHSTYRENTGYSYANGVSMLSSEGKWQEVPGEGRTWERRLEAELAGQVA